MRTVLFSLAAFLITFISCDKPVEETQYQFPVIEINHCADTTINGNVVRICFDSLIRDSRCPINANCVWQGEATVKLSLQIGNGQSQSFQLSTFNNPPAFRNDTIVSGHKIKLLSVSPYPGDETTTPYRIQISVTR
jgi:hypothetical protein